MTDPTDVTRQQLEILLTGLVQKADDKQMPESHGFFGPKSMTWKIGQESAVFLGSAYALWMQEAHPWVAVGAHNHSKVRKDPLGRWNRTFKAVNAMLMGDRAEAIKYSRMIFNMHSRVHGKLDNGEDYAANNSEALLWVGSTLVYTATMCYEMSAGTLTAQEKEQHYQEFKSFFYMFGIDPHVIPEDWNAFLQYYNGMIHSGKLRVTPEARQMVEHFTSILSPIPANFRLPADAVLAFSAGLLPENIREQYGLKFDLKERIMHAMVLQTLKTVYPKIPRKLRMNPYFRKVLKRVGS